MPFIATNHMPVIQEFLHPLQLLISKHFSCDIMQSPTSGWIVNIIFSYYYYHCCIPPILFSKLAELLYKERPYDQHQYDEQEKSTEDAAEDNLESLPFA